MILNSEPTSEFVSNRQNSKISFLQHENNQLREYVRDLESQAKLNKEALKITLTGNHSNSNFKQHLTIEEQQLHQYQQLVEKLNEENQRLLQSMQNLSKEKQESMTKQLLQEQIYEENLNFYKTTIQDLEDKLIELKRNLHDKEYSIQELERSSIQQNKFGQSFKVIDVVAPNEQIIRMHDESENLRTILQKTTMESSFIAEQNKKIKLEIRDMHLKYYKLFSIFESNINYSIAKQFIHHENIFDKSFYQFPTFDTQEQLKTLDTQYNQQGFGNYQMQQMKYLNKNERMVYQEKQHKLELMIKGFKELYEKEKIVNLQLSRKLEELESMYDRVLFENEQIIKSNQSKDENCQNLVKELKFYRKQHGSMMNVLTSRRQNSQHNFDFLKLDLAVENQPKTTQIARQRQRGQQQSIGDRLFSENDYEFPLSPKVLKTCNSPTNNENSNKMEEFEFNQILKQKQNRFQQKPPLPLIIDDEETNCINPYGRTQTQTYVQTQRNENMKKQLFELPQIEQQLNNEMNSYECKDFVMNMKRQFDEEFKILVENYKKKLLMKQIGSILQKTKKVRTKRSFSDPFVYFTQEKQKLNGEKNPLKKQTLPQVREQLKQQQRQIELKNKQKDKIFFQTDVSVITHNINKNSFKKKVTIKEQLSFISEDDVINDF